VRGGDFWAPLGPLGPEAARRIERAVGALPEDEALAVIERAERGESFLEEAVNPDSERSEAPGPLARRAALLAARFALRARGGHGDADAIGQQAAEAFSLAGDERARAFVDVERATLLASDKTRLPEAQALAAALPLPEADPALSAAVHRARGAISRARADLRGSLLDLERARALAEASGSAREIVRAGNTLGTSYAALGVAALAREALERARELAELLGHRQSAAIASGQLAVLAMDAGRPLLAARHLEAQRSICDRLGDTHGLARSLSLLVEAFAAAHEPARARAAADEVRALYARSPAAWTRLQAVMATIYEAEDALSSGDLPRASELLASCSEELRSDAPSLRVARARSAFVLLWQALRSLPPLTPPAGGLAPTTPVEEQIEHALAQLRRSPRPTWVERALLLSVDVARSRGRDDLVAPLALRAASLLELRGSAAAAALTTLRELAPDAAVARAMALGRDLVLRARLALAPLRPFRAELVTIEVGGEPGLIDRAVLGFEPAEAAARLDDASVGLLVYLDGARRALVAAPDDATAARGASYASAVPGVISVRRERAMVELVADPSTGLVLSAV
jgi:hypothetical protein